MRGSTFRSGKGFEGVMSRDAYACGFDVVPTEYFLEINYISSNFGPPSIVRTGLKSKFRTVRSHVAINFEEKFGWIKIEAACICVT